MRLVRRGVPRRQRQPVPGDHVEHLRHFREQRTVTHHRNERPTLLVHSHAVLGIEGRHPDDLAEPAGDLRHVFDRRRIDSSDRAIEDHTANDLHVRDDFRYHPGQRRGGIEMVFKTIARMPRVRACRATSIASMERGRSSGRLCTWMSIEPARS